MATWGLDQTSSTSLVDNKGIIDGLGRGELKYIGPKAKDGELWMLIWEKVRTIHQEGTLLEVEGASLKGREAGNVALRTLCHGRQRKDG